MLTLSLLGADSPSPHGSMWVVWFAPVVGLDGAPRVGARHSFAPNGFPLVAWSDAAVTVVRGVNHMKSTATCVGPCRSRPRAHAAGIFQPLLTKSAPAH